MAEGFSSHSFTDSLTHTHTLNLSLAHPLTVSHSHTLTHTLTHTLSHSLTHSHSHTHIHLPTHSLTHPPTHCLTHTHTHTLTHTLSHSPTHSLSHSHTLTHPPTHPPALLSKESKHEVRCEMINVLWNSVFQDVVCQKLSVLVQVSLRNNVLWATLSGRQLGSSHGSVVTVIDLCPANLGLTPAGTHMSHWWRQEGHPAKITPVC